MNPIGFRRSGATRHRIDYETAVSGELRVELVAALIPLFLGIAVVGPIT